MIFVIFNLLKNALYAIHANGRGQIEIDAHRSNGYCVVRFSDTGPGIAPDVLPQIFDAFFSTKSHGRGAGMGLSFAAAHVKRSVAPSRVNPFPACGPRSRSGCRAGAPADPTLNGPPALPLSRRVGRSHIQFAVDGRISSYALTRSMMPGGNRRIRLSEPANTIC